MSRVRRIRKGSTWLITRRCSDGKFLLRPDKRCNAIVWYCVAYAAAKFNIDLHAVEASSNHIHLVVTDNEANLPQFAHLCFGLMARAINAHRGRWGDFWEGDSYSGVELLTDQAIIDKIVYTITNPIKDHLVAASHLWPGALISPRHYGQTKTFDRPKTFFRKVSADAGGLPEQVSLHAVPPPLSTKTMTQTLIKRIDTEEAAIVLRAKKLGQTFLGRKNILRQSPFDTPRGKLPRRELNPRIATGDGGGMRLAKQELKAFYVAYAAALAEFSKGVRDVLFPHGTYQMQIQYGCSCGPAG